MTEPNEEKPDHVEPGEGIGEPDPVLAELDRLRAREDELLRALAEQQNVVRRRRQEMETSVRYAQESLLQDLLPVLDDFERAIEAMKRHGDEAIGSGIAMVYERFLRTLERQGLEPIRPRPGESFNPDLHDALAQRHAAGSPAGTVLDVAQPGYRLRDRVLRHAKVVVAGPADSDEVAPVAGENAP
jgi:molecular chaperone GrpE